MVSSPVPACGVKSGEQPEGVKALRDVGEVGAQEKVDSELKEDQAQVNKLDQEEIERAALHLKGSESLNKSVFLHVRC